MSDLETSLQAAAEADDVTFDHDDIRRGVARRQRVRAAAGGVAVVIIAIVVGTSLVLGDADDTGVASESGMVGALTVEEFTADLWVPESYSGVTAGVEGGFVEFGDDGSFAALFGCEVVTGRWSSEAGALRLEDVETQSGCGDGNDTGFGELARGEPVVERFASDESLLLRSGEDFVAFNRFDRLGAEPTAANLVGAWEYGDATLTFRDDGSVVVAVALPPGVPEATPDGPCEATTRYRIEDDSIVFADDLSDGIECGDGGLAGGLSFLLSGEPRARVDDGPGGARLWLANEFGVARIDGVEARTEPTSGPDQRSAKDIAESVMEDVFGVGAVTMAADDVDGLTVVTMDADGQEIVARVAGSYGSFSIVDIASTDELTFLGEEGQTPFRVAHSESGSLTVRGIVGSDEPRADQVEFTDTVAVTGAGVTDSFDPGEVTWLVAELVTDRGPTLYLLSRL